MPTLSPFIRRAVLASAIALTASAMPASAEARDQAFFTAVAGTWKGPGEIVAGKYKGTKFVCDLAGDALARGETGIALDGTCRVGIFSQKMSAIINQTQRGYTGRFLDGAAGKGLDVTSGEVRANKVVVGIHRQQLSGAMVASLQSPDTMNVTVSVRVNDRLVPVIGMTLTRDLDRTAVGSIK